MRTRRLLLASLTFSAVLTGGHSVLAQSYPSRPITMIVPVPPAGALDPMARVLAERMKASLGQPVIIENVTGAGGSIGVGRVARAPADGYTLSIGNWLTHVGSSAIYPVQYDVLKDFEPVSLLTSSPVWIVAKKSFPATDLPALISWLKNNPDAATAATVGPGSAAHVAGAYFQQVTGTRFRFVPYRGGGPLSQDLVAGHVDLTFGEASTHLQSVRSGLLKAYAVMAEKRWFAAPEAPTVDELGLQGLHLAFWQGLWVPSRTPKAVIAKLNSAVVAALADPAFRERISDLGQEIFPPGQQTPEALRIYHEAEVKKWWPIIRRANIKGE
jgi:tripartite-type tricarboxylate transporter receptor subunit TctC